MTHLRLLLAATLSSRLLAARRECLATGGVLTPPLLASLRIGRATLLAALSLELLVVRTGRLRVRSSLWRLLSGPGHRWLLTGGLRRRLAPVLGWLLTAGGLGLLPGARRPWLTSSALSTLPTLRFLGLSPRWLPSRRLLALLVLLALRGLLGLSRILGIWRSLARRGLGTVGLLPARR